MIKNTLNHTLVYLLAGVILWLDQYTKHLVRVNIPLNETWNPLPWLIPYARLLHIQNTGAAFGMFQNLGPIFSVIAVIVTGVIVFYNHRLPAGQWWVRVALGLQLGGALGNLIDRLFFNMAVTDFISVGQFAIFNVADASISVGVAVLVLLMLFTRPTAPAAHSRSASPPTETA